MKPYWITFYSYKGGVGRSLALANIGAMLVQRGHRVLLIDFDLEAPGLDSFSEFSDAAGKRGVVEYVSQYIRTQQAPRIGDFVHKCNLHAHLRGDLWVMPAGRKDAVYNHQLGRIHWAELYEQKSGYAFFANWKAAIDAEFNPDYVLIDSRTGLTEVGGVCTTFFPDLVVMLFALNEQNIHGIATVAQSIRQADPDRVAQLHFVATPVPNLPPELPPPSDSERRHSQLRPTRDRRSLLAARLDAAKELLGLKVTSLIHYYPPACLTEKLFVFDQGFLRQSIGRDYDALRNQITAFNRTGLDFLLAQMEAAIAADDGPKMEKVAVVLERDYSERAEALYARSRYARAQKDTDKALDYAKQAFAIDPSYEESFDFLLRHFQRLGRFSEVVAMCKTATAADLPSKRRYAIETFEAEALMVLHRYAEAAAIFQRCLDFAMNNSEGVVDSLIHSFNAAEATRRSGKVPSKDIWNGILQIFTSAEAAAAEIPPPSLANFWQARHIPLACAGYIDAARDALVKARRIGESVGEIDDIFCVRSYRYCPAQTFLHDNDEMLAALDRSQLWDGMPLPAPKQNSGNDADPEKRPRRRFDFDEE